MTLVVLGFDELSRMESYLLACGWVDQQNHFQHGREERHKRVQQNNVTENIIPGTSRGQNHEVLLYSVRIEFLSYSRILALRDLLIGISLVDDEESFEGTSKEYYEIKLRNEGLPTRESLYELYKYFCKERARFASSSSSSSSSSTFHGLSHLGSFRSHRFQLKSCVYDIIFNAMISLNVIIEDFTEILYFLNFKMFSSLRICPIQFVNKSVPSYSSEELHFWKRISTDILLLSSYEGAQLSKTNTAGGIIVLTTRYFHSGWMIVHLCFGTWT
ncbi:hypothetical protein ANN_14544 [Periplaneta americana]|uniref:Uncharacterized protein n=1 Tax=Periplaneta americana TaxID=6978 RepID=A0ABQ8SWL5_PERAM|nr:hypothetical protein ANN_14544 [Periplaneta americana]